MSESPRFNFFRLVKISQKNHPLQTIITIVVFAVLASTLFSAQYLITGAEQGLDDGTSRMGADLIVIPEGSTASGENILFTGSPGMFFFNDSGFEQISRINGVAEVSPEIFVASLSGQTCCSGYVQIIAIDPERDFTISPWLIDNPGIRMGEDDVIVGSRIDGDIGSDLIFYGHTFHIAGRLGSSGMRGVDTSVFTRIEDTFVMAEESGIKAAQPLIIPRGRVSSVLVKVEPGASADFIAGEISRQIPGTRTITQNGLLNTITLHLAGITRFLNNATIAVMVISIPLLGMVSFLVARELKKEIAVLGALGATKEFIVRLVFTTSFLSSVIGSALGIGITMVILISFQDVIALSLGIPFSVPSPPALLTVGGKALIPSIAIGALASIYPTIRIIRSGSDRNVRESG